MATGMSLALCFSTLKKQRPSAKYILWSRIDQKSCFKSMILANMEPIVIETLVTDAGLITDIDTFKFKIEEIGGPEQILCILSTTSCFAPRQSDNIIELAKLAADTNIPHVINNAYGLQSKWFCNRIEHCHRSGGRIDMFVQSTDKNLMVPVGGAIIAGFKSSEIKSVAEHYAGRASASQTLDVFMTLLSLGRTEYIRLSKDREEVFEYLKDSIQNLDVKLIKLQNNPISIAFTLNKYNFEWKKLTMLGSMLYKRGVSGARVLTTLDHKSIEGVFFQGIFYGLLCMYTYKKTNTSIYF